MSEMLDEKALMRERRGKTLNVLAILSWVSMGIAGLNVLFALVGGPMSAEDIQNIKVEMLSLWSEEEIELIGKTMIEEMFSRFDIMSELHYSLIGIQLAYLILGAYGVLQMYNLKRVGYYYYVAYSIIPVVVELAIFGTGPIAMFIAISTSVFSLLFCILYAFQLKRLS